MHTILCPTCGGFLGEIPEISKLRRVLTKTEYLIAEAIFKAGPAGIEASDLALQVYGPRIGGSESKRESVRVQVSALRRKVETLGFFIPKADSHRRKYRIQALEVTA